jgi:hypothetical protein
MAKIAGQIPNRARCHLIPYNTTSLERDPALTLAIRQVIIKTNEGVSGAGNALVDLAGIVGLPEEHQLPQRVRARRDDNGRRDTGAGDGDLRTGPAHPSRRGQGRAPGR